MKINFISVAKARTVHLYKCTERIHYGKTD